MNQGRYRMLRKMPIGANARRRDGVRPNLMRVPNTRGSMLRMGPG
jgi:hypothetical protein